MRSLLLVSLLVAACGGGAPSFDAAATPPDDGGLSDAEVASDAELVSDGAAPASPAGCPTSGKGAITVSDARCVVFTPAAAGADPAGVNATVNDYALAPTAGNGHLVLFLNPSLGSPAQSIADPATNIYTAATAAGDHVLAIAYRSNEVIGVVCANDDGCYLPTRMALVTGTSQPGAAASIDAGILPSEGIHARAALALAYLAAAEPQQGWGQYLAAGADPGGDPANAIDWSKVIVMGHSQGGGHAALLAKLHAVYRLVTLSSPCDEVSGAPASWLTSSAGWASAPASVAYGFASQTTFDGSGAAVGGDTTCPVHAAIWTTLGYATANTHDDAQQCAGASAHTATTQCPANMPEVQALVTP